MLNYAKELLSTIRDIRKNYPVVWWVAALAAITAFVIASSFAMSGSWDVFILGSFFAILIIVSVAAMHCVDKFLGKFIENKTAISFLRGVSFFAVIASTFAYFTWLSLTAIIAFSDFGLVCTDQDVSSPRSQGVGVEKVGRECATQKHVVEYTITPLITVTWAKNAEISRTIPLGYKRPSCSGRSHGEFTACLPEGAKVESVEINNFFVMKDNGLLKLAENGKAYSNTDKFPEEKSSWAVDQPQQHCAIIPWSVASGGRTGIGECRYHGAINFDAKLTGTFSETKAGERADSSQPGNKTIVGDVHSVFLKYDISDNPQPTANNEKPDSNDQTENNDGTPTETAGNDAGSQNPAQNGNTDNDSNGPEIVGWKYDITVTQMTRKIAREVVTWTDQLAGTARKSDSPDTAPYSRCLRASIVDHEDGRLLIKISC